MPNTGCTRLANDCKSSLPEIPNANTPSNGKPTPVTKNPALAIQTFSPAD